MASNHAHATTSSPEGRPPQLWLDDAIAHDPVLSPLTPHIRRLAASDAPVLISGEPGSGRQLAARAIHNLSSRAAHPFTVVDCADLSDPLIAAELLGVSGGHAAPPYKTGVVEQAGAGTVLLAEVGEVPLHLQDALLRLLDRHEVVRLASNTPINTPARCLATTSIDLKARVDAGLFRADLYSRLVGERLDVPALRDRRGDIVSLARHFLAQLFAHLPPAATELTPAAEQALRAYAWPANVFELREAVEQAALGAQGGPIGFEHLPVRLRTQPEGGSLPSLRDLEKHYIERVLDESRGNQRRASRVLGISRWSLSRRLRKYGMQVHDA